MLKEKEERIRITVACLTSVIKKEELRIYCSLKFDALRNNGFPKREKERKGDN